MKTAAAALLPVRERARRRIARRLLPYLVLLFVVAFLDRVNVGYAALDMTRALGFSPAVYGFGAGIFFIGYFLLEIPGSVLVEVWSARLTVARIMVLWGVVAILTGFIHSATQFYWARFLLGAMEAGFFPGIIVYLSHWFTNEDRGKAVAIFMAALPIANVIGAPLSGLLLGIHWLGIEGWRWLFIVEGAPSVVLGIVTLFYLTDWPHQATWLPDDEREWIAGELERENAAKREHSPARIFTALHNPRVVVLTAAYFFIVTAANGFYFWLPTVLKNFSGASNLRVSLFSTVPYGVGFVSMLLVGWSSDRTGERRWHSALPMLAVGAGLVLAVSTRNHGPLAVAFLCLAGVGIFAYLPGFWALPTAFLTGTAAAASIGLVNSVGNLGGFVGPSVVGYINNRTHSFFGGALYLAVSSAIAAALVLSIRPPRLRK